MLSIFPSLLILGIFAPFILRMAVGLYFFYTGYHHLQKEQESIVKEAKKYVPFAKPLMVFSALIEIVIGLSLIAGFLTQIASLVGIIYILILLRMKKACPVFVRRERILYVMILVILLSLLFTGAGAIAVDLPL